MSEDIHELSRLRREKKRFKSSGNLHELSNVCNGIGEILAHLGRYEEALEEHKTEKEICTKLKDELGVAVANRKIGECHSELGNYVEALEHQHKHLEIAHKLKNYVEEQRAWATIGRTHYYRAAMFAAKEEEENLKTKDDEMARALNSAEEAFLKSLDVCSRLKSDVGEVELAQMQGRLFLNLGLVLDHRGDLDGSTQFIQKAIVINTERGLKEDLLRCHHSLSINYHRHEDLEMALAHVQQAISAFDAKTDLGVQCEVLTFYGRLLLLQSSYKDSKDVLRRAQKMSVADESLKKEAVTLWMIASKLCSTEQRLFNLPTDDLFSRVKMYEKMGDLCCRVPNYEKALYYYDRSLEFAQQLGSSMKDLAPLYLSLAQTYSDVGQDDRAAHYYRLELGCWEGNPKECCRTLLNIADKEEINGKEYDFLKRLYNEALNYAREVGCISLQRRCLESLSVVQKTFGVVMERKTTTQILESLPKEDLTDDEVEDDVSVDSPVSSDESSIDDEDDAAECIIDKSRCRTKKFRMRRNEKGETPLHRACISGDFKLVKQLIDQGHPVNIRDYSGWLPLHEAANHDHSEVVKILLDRGAWINDRGGEKCDGMTPLHDAATNGNVAVMDILIDRGGDVLAKNAFGETVLSCLKKWRDRAKNDTDSEILNESVRMEDKIKEMVANVVKFVDDTSETPIDDTVTDRALVDENQLIQNGIDNWLINDMPNVSISCNRKRRRSNRSPVISRFSSATSKLSLLRHRTHSTARKRLRTACADDDIGINFESGLSRDLNVLEIDTNDRPSSSDDFRDPFPVIATSLHSSPEPTTSAMIVDTSNSSSILRIKVNILEKLMLVPTPIGETVTWLANEAAQRYYLLHGLRPILSLSTKEGALLATVDVINHVISPDEEVVGTVTSWDLPPLTERYTEACTTLCETPYRNVMEVLREAKETVCLSNQRLTSKCARPIFRALQCQYTITELLLAGNRLGNEGLNLLSQSLDQLSGLKFLDLSCNDITDVDLSHLVSVFSMSSIALQRLEVLKLGFNPIMEGSCSNLSSLLGHLKALRELHLPSCCTSPSYDSSSLKIISQASHVQLLNLCFCCLADKHIANLGVTFANSFVSLKRLELSGVSTKPSDARALCKGLVQYLNGPPCQLKELVLSHCSLDDESLTLLATSIVEERITKLTLLDISYNALLSPGIINKLFPTNSISKDLSIFFKS